MEVSSRKLKYFFYISGGTSKASKAKIYYTSPKMNKFLSYFNKFFQTHF